MRPHADVRPPPPIPPTLPQDIIRRSLDTVNPLNLLTECLQGSNGLLLASKTTYSLVVSAVAAARPCPCTHNPLHGPGCAPAVHSTVVPQE
jgi:hypothetical protein